MRVRKCFTYLNYMETIQSKFVVVMQVHLRDSHSLVLSNNKSHPCALFKKSVPRVTQQQYIVLCVFKPHTLWIARLKRNTAVINDGAYGFAELKSTRRTPFVLVYMTICCKFSYSAEHYTINIKSCKHCSFLRCLSLFYVQKRMSLKDDGMRHS